MKTFGIFLVVVSVAGLYSCFYKPDMIAHSGEPPVGLQDILAFITFIILGIICVFW